MNRDPLSVHLASWSDRKGAAYHHHHHHRRHNNGDDYDDDDQEWRRSLAEQVRPFFRFIRQFQFCSVKNKSTHFLLNQVNSGGKVDQRVLVAKPWKRQPLPQVQVDKKTTVTSTDINPHAKKLADARAALNPTPKPKQFFFGQEEEDRHKDNKQHKQTAIDKVKNNEAVTHPKNILINPGYKIKDYVDPTVKAGVPSFAFGETPPPKPKSASNNNKKPDLPAKPQVEKTVKKNKTYLVSSESPEPEIKPVVKYSNYIQPMEQEFKVPRPNLVNGVKNSGGKHHKHHHHQRHPQPERSQDEVNREFEVALLQEKSRLRATGSYTEPPRPPLPASVGKRDVDADSGISMVPSPPPPPPPPATAVLLNGNGNGTRNDYTSNQRRSNTLGSARPKQTAASVGNPRDALMAAIRDAGGIHGLKKVCNCGFICQFAFFTHTYFRFSDERRQESLSKPNDETNSGNK